jgi:hypothetical protein
MASIEHEIQVDLEVERVWDAMADIGRIHERLVPGFVTGCRMEGRVRVVTFGNGMIVREPIIDVDPRRRRVAWAAVGAPFEHYSASLQAFETPGGTRRTICATRSTTWSGRDSR